jgi:hypothetical protein
MNKQLLRIVFVVVEKSGSSVINYYMVDYAPVFDCYEYLCQNFICLGLIV